MNTYVIVGFVIVLLIWFIFSANKKTAKLRNIGVMAGTHYLKTGDKAALVAFECVAVTCSKPDQVKLKAELDTALMMTSAGNGDINALTNALNLEQSIKASAAKKRELANLSEDWLKAVMKYDLDSAKKAMS